eukprot:m.25812 g.25812  ORF g.25812 m.25812 type:complete len:368 (+) comp28978_c0_seq2:194-1297(+)
MALHLWLFFVLFRWKCDAMLGEPATCASQTDRCLSQAGNFSCDQSTLCACEQAQFLSDCLQSLDNGSVCDASNLHFFSHKTQAEHDMRTSCEGSSSVGTSRPPGAPSVTPRPSPLPNGCDWNRSRNKSASVCLLFGDPHIVTFAGSEQTCRILGRHRLLAFGDDAVVVDVVNVPVSTALEATATSQVTVSFEPSACTGGKALRYVAEGGHLDAQFADGSAPTHLIKRTNSERVDLLASWANVHIRIRRFGMYYTVATQVAEYVIGRTVGLCQSGCPAGEILLDDTAGKAPRGNITHFYACDEVEEKSFYFKSCVFDYETTGNLNFTAAAREAERDLLELKRSHTAPQRALPVYIIASIAVVLYTKTA